MLPGTHLNHAEKVMHRLEHRVENCVFVGGKRAEITSSYPSGQGTYVLVVVV